MCRTRAPRLPPPRPQQAIASLIFLVDYTKGLPGLLCLLQLWVDVLKRLLITASL